MPLKPFKAWKYHKDLVDNAKGELVIEKDEDWVQTEAQQRLMAGIRMQWQGRAPASGAPCSLLAGAIQSVENMGCYVEEAEALFAKGLKALSEGDDGLLTQLTGNIYQLLENAEKDPASPYWQFTHYHDWNSFLADCRFPAEGEISRTEVVGAPLRTLAQIDKDVLQDKLKAGWLGQICAGSFGTAVEGYARHTILRDFAPLTGYLKPPSPYNDDITFQIALLDVMGRVEHPGEMPTSQQIADGWLRMIPFGYSAEGVALQNLMTGVTPPESGRRRNPFREWIGAQMRGSVCGMLYPCQPQKAAELAWRDGCVSHDNNGIIGEVYNALLTSMAFAYGKQTERVLGKDGVMRDLLRRCADMLPQNSQYTQVVQEVLAQCAAQQTPEPAFRWAEERYKEFNLVHAYPNIAIQLIALWYGEGKYSKSLRLCCEGGQDTDSNAGQVGNIVAILTGTQGIDSHWTAPLGETLKTYVRGYEEIDLEALYQMQLATKGKR